MKAINKTKTFALGLISLFILGFTQPSFSYSKTQDPIEFYVLPSVNNNPLFQFRATNTEVTEYLIKVKDGDGNMLYSESLKGKNLLRKYQFDITPEVSSPFDVTFEVTNLQTQKTFVYKASRKTREVQDIILAKL